MITLHFIIMYIFTRQYIFAYSHIYIYIWVFYFKNFPNVCYPLDLRLMKWQTHLEEKYEATKGTSMIAEWVCTTHVFKYTGYGRWCSMRIQPCVQCKLCTLALPVKTWTNKYVSQQPQWQSEQDDSELRRVSENLFMPDLLCKSSTAWKNITN